MPCNKAGNNHICSVRNAWDFVKKWLCGHITEGDYLILLSRVKDFSVEKERSILEQQNDRCYSSLLYRITDDGINYVQGSE